MTAITAVVGRPLLGSTVVITAERRATELGAALERRGARVVQSPVMSIVPHVDDTELVAATRRLLQEPPDAVVVTTGIGFRGWMEAADAAGVVTELLEVLGRARLLARGPKAQGAIQAAGLQADWVAESETTGEIRDLMLGEGVRGLRVAVQHHGYGADGIDEALHQGGATVHPLVVYRWGPTKDPEAVEAALRCVAALGADAVTFTSAPGAAAWLDAAQRLGLREQVISACTRPDGVLTVAVGPVTAAPLRQAGIEPVVPDRARLGALVRSVTQALVERPGVQVQTPSGRLRVLRAAAVIEQQPVALSPSSLAVLRLLAEARGDVVPRSVLLSSLPGTSRDEHAAEVAVARLREGLGARDLVQTVVKRGYRLRVVAGP